jgi:hypothetical protein
MKYVPFFKKMPFLSNLVNRLKNMILEEVAFRFSTKQNSLLVYPPLVDEAELLDLCYKIRYFLPQHLVDRVSVCIADTIQFAGDFLPVPEYVTAEPILTNSFEWIRHSKIDLKRLLQADWILVWDEKTLSNDIFLKWFSAKIKHVDRHASVWEGWSWAGLGHNISLVEHKIFPDQVQLKFNSYIESLPQYDKAYVFGTGPSLDCAYQFDFSDGYRVVCNTIVKNKRLLKHISPHFIVAADAIYHFGNNNHAHQFRCDLEEALNTTGAMFLTADFFSYLLYYHHPAINERILPLRTDLTGMFLEMKKQFAYTSLPNILNGILLPLGSSLSDEIYLLGFDGRAPSDNLFWKNSDDNSYEGLKPTIRMAHPGFFDKMDYEDYSRLQSDAAEQLMALGETMGKKYYSLNQTFIPALQKRQHPNAIRIY